MNIKTIKAAMAGLVLSVSGFANAGIIPVGVQEDVAYTDVINTWGWDLLYRGNYSEDNVSFSSLFNGHDDYIMLGAIQDGSNTIELLAAVLWTDFMTHTAKNVTNVANGAQWYNNAGSFGYAGLGDAINQGSADVTNGTNDHHRLSWHGQQGGYGNIANTMRLGYRAGATQGLNNSTAWDRVIFTANATNVPEPSTLAILALGIMGLASRRFKKKA
jgi:hypothetical protein